MSGITSSKCYIKRLIELTMKKILGFTTKSLLTVTSEHYYKICSDPAPNATSKARLAKLNFFVLILRISLPTLQL